MHKDTDVSVEQSAYFFRVGLGKGDARRLHAPFDTQEGKEKDCSLGQLEGPNNCSVGVYLGICRTSEPCLIV
jgi:hypothetical protein